MIFLDIELRELNGINVGSKIRNDLKNESIQIVYISEKTAMHWICLKSGRCIFWPNGKGEMILSVLEKGLELSIN